LPDIPGLDCLICAIFVRQVWKQRQLVGEIVGGDIEVGAFEDALRSMVLSWKVLNPTPYTRHPIVGGDRCRANMAHVRQSRPWLSGKIP